jgi:FHA domain
VCCMTTAIPDRHGATGQADTETHQPTPGVLGHGSLRGSVSFERPAPGRYLALQEGELTRLVPLRGLVTHLGRGFSADLRLEDQSVSRRHAVIVERPDAVQILDDRSANGTFVNGQRVSEAILQDLDEICLGRVAMVYVEIAGTRPNPG